MHLFRLLVWAVALTTAGMSMSAHAQGQTRTLDDLVAEYRAQCGKNGSKERLLLAFDRAIDATKSKKRIMLLKRRRDLVANPQAPVCPPDPVVAAPAPTAAPSATASDGTPAVEDICKRPAPNPRAGECATFKLLLGRWHSRGGGVIELFLTPDGTVSGTIIVTSKWMRDYGYREGMAVFRNWVPRVGSANWVVFGQDGESYYTTQPNNKYGEPYTTGQWNKGGVVAINRDSVDVIGFPNTERLSNYGNWSRTGAP